MCVSIIILGLNLELTQLPKIKNDKFSSTEK